MAGGLMFFLVEDLAVVLVSVGFWWICVCIHGRALLYLPLYVFTQWISD